MQICQVALCISPCGPSFGVCAAEHVGSHHQKTPGLHRNLVHFAACASPAACCLSSSTSYARPAHARLRMLGLKCGSVRVPKSCRVHLNRRRDLHAKGDRVLQALLIGKQRDSIWDDLDICPRTCPSKMSRCCTYARWFARPPGLHARSLLDIPVSAACMKGLLCFRMGCHRLPRDEWSWARPQVPRLERLCRLCATCVLGD